MGDDAAEVRAQYSWWSPPGPPTEPQVEPPDVYDVYARLSYNVHGQKESCERQISDCSGLASRLDLPIGEIHVDDNLSAWQEGVRRPGWEATLARLRERQIRGVIVWHGDRYIRRPMDLIALLEAAEAGAVIHSYGSGQRDLTNPEHRRILWYEVIHADASSEDTSRRVRRGLLAAAEAGRPAVGRRGYGYGVPTGVLGPDGREIIDKTKIVEAEAEVIRDAAGRVLAGESLNSIVVGLADAGVPTLRGGRWDVTTLRTILSAPRIAGLRVHRGEIVGRAAWPPIIPEARWRELQAALAAEAPPPQRHPDREYLASGLAVCGRDGCGARLTTRCPWEGEVAKRGKRMWISMPAAYLCRRRPRYGGCGRTYVNAGDLDGYLAALLRAVAADPAALAGRSADGVRAEEAAELARVEAELTELARRWGQQSGARRMTLAEYGELRAGLADRRDELEARLAGRDRPSAGAVAGGLVWDEMGYRRRRMFARAVVDAVVVAPSPRRGGGFDAGRVAVRWR